MTPGQKRAKREGALIRVIVKEILDGCTKMRDREVCGSCMDMIVMCTISPRKAIKEWEQRKSKKCKE